jgi:hypothetical protein
MCGRGKLTEPAYTGLPRPIAAATSLAITGYRQQISGEERGPEHESPYLQTVAREETGPIAVLAAVLAAAASLALAGCGEAASAKTALSAQAGKPPGESTELGQRQIDENVIFNLADQRPDLLTGVNPATGQPQPYGSVGVDINCAVIGYTAKAPIANLAPSAPLSQFPPR